MGFFYFDESIHERGSFIIGAFVYHDEDLGGAVFEALAEAGLKPGVDEFKSSAKMTAQPEQVKARENLRSVFNSVSTGLVVLPSTRRASLGDEAVLALVKIVPNNGLATGNHQVFFDQGISVSDAARDLLSEALGSSCELRLDQDSRKVGGLQLADLAAYSMGVMLLEQLGLIKKLVKAGENSGYDPDLDIELGFELWASLRYSFFKASQPKPGQKNPNDPVGDLIFDVENYGLHIAKTCDENLARAALLRFGECSLGCIH